MIDAAVGETQVSPPSLDSLLLELDCQALVVLATSSRDSYLAPFLAAGRLHRSLLVAPRGGSPRLAYMTPMERGEAATSGLDLLTPEALDVLRWSREGASPAQFLGNVLSRALQLCEVASGRLAVAGNVSAGEVLGAAELLAAEGWSFVPGEGVVERLRKRKTNDQIASIEEAAVGTCEAMRRVASLLAASTTTDTGALVLEGEPLAVGRLRSEIARTLSERGLEQPWGNIVAPAEEGAVPHNSGTDDRQLRAGESLVVDVFPKSRLAADCTRTFCVGEPSDPLARGHAEVLAALEASAASARPGVRAWDLQAAVCEHFAGSGWPTPVDTPGTTRGYVHGLGHGVGFEVHEMPSFRQEANAWEGCLEVGDVITLEPGLYEPEPTEGTVGWAVRLEDLYVVEPDGVRNLTPLPYDLDPRAWD